MKTLAQLGRFGVVGVVLNVALYVLYLILTAAGIVPIMASTMAFVVGVPLSLGAHRRLTFRVGKISNARKLAFVVLYVAMYGVMIGTLSVLHHGLSMPHEIAQAIAIVVAAALSFSVQKTGIFRA